MNYVGADPNMVNNPWDKSLSYALDQLVYYKGMYYRAKSTVIQNQNPPDIWFDEDGDYISDSCRYSIYSYKVSLYVARIYIHLLLGWLSFFDGCSQC